MNLQRSEGSEGPDYLRPVQYQLGWLDQGPEGRLQDGSTAQVVDKLVLAVAELSWAWGQRATFSMWAPLPVSFFIVGGMSTHEKGSES